MRREHYEKFVEEINTRITMLDVIEKYGGNVVKGSFVNCFFHNEKTSSLKLYEKSFYCFGCGKGGDIITFVREMFGLSFMQAIIRIDSDFSLVLPLFKQLTPKELYLENKKVKELKRQIEQKKKEDEEKEYIYWNAFNEWVRLDRNKRIYNPKNTDGIMHPLFFEALQKLAYQEYLLDCADINRWVVK